MHLCGQWDVLMCVGGLQKVSLFRFFSGNGLSGSATNGREHFGIITWLQTGYKTLHFHIQKNKKVKK